MAYEKLVNSIKTRFQDSYIIVHVTSPHPFEVLLRSNISTQSEAEDFLSGFSKMTKTEWNVRYEIKKPRKSIFHKKWICHHSSRNKNQCIENRKNWDCYASIDLYIKRITRNVKAKDEYLCRSPPLAAVISIYPDHTHDVKSKQILQMRSVPNEIRDKFIKYFEMGLSIPEAQYLHVSLLSEENPENLLDTAINPKFNQVACMYRLWRKQKPKIVNNYNTPIFDLLDDQCMDFSFEDLTNYDWSSFQFLEKEVVEEVYNNTAEQRPAEKGAVPSVNSPELDDGDSCSSYERALIEDATIESDDDYGFEKNDITPKPDENDSPQKIGDSSYIVEYTDTSETDPMITYYVLESTKFTKQRCEVSHDNALACAKTLLNYMESQNDTDLADIITVRRYMRKIRNNIILSKGTI